jgi:hypothetical protein
MIRGGVVNETVSFTETISKTLIRPYYESVTFTEETSLDNAQYRFSDFVYFYEVITKTLYKNHVEYLPLIETISKRVTKPFIEILYFIENILQHRIISYKFSEYLAFYEAPPRKTVTKFIQDTLVTINEVVDKVLRSGSKIWFWKTDERLYLNEYIHKQIEKYETEQVEFDEDFSMRLTKPDKITLFWKMDRVRFSESFQKTVKVFKTEDVSFLMTYSKNQVYLIQDTVTFIESFIKTVRKPIIETVPFSEVVNIAHTIPMYFDAGEIYPQYSIGDLRLYGGAEMHFYPKQTAVLKWNLRDFSLDSLVDPDSHTIEIYDCRNSLRVAYDATKLLKTAVGQYRYYFNVPADVVVGDWYAKVTAIKGTSTTVLTIHFEVKNR